MLDHNLVPCQARAVHIQWNEALDSDKSFVFIQPQFFLADWSLYTRMFVFEPGENNPPVCESHAANPRCLLLLRAGGFRPCLFSFLLIGEKKKKPLVKFFCTLWVTIMKTQLIEAGHTVGKLDVLLLYTATRTYFCIIMQKAYLNMQSKILCSRHLKKDVLLMCHNI